jgi:hypothetical protein
MAVGETVFTDGAASGFRWRQHLEREESPPGTWSLREGSMGFVYAQKA